MRSHSWNRARVCVRVNAGCLFKQKCDFTSEYYWIFSETGRCGPHLSASVFHPISPRTAVSCELPCGCRQVPAAVGVEWVQSERGRVPGRVGAGCCPRAEGRAKGHRARAAWHTGAPGGSGTGWGGAVRLAGGGKELPGGFTPLVPGQCPSSGQPRGVCGGTLALSHCGAPRRGLEPVHLCTRAVSPPPARSGPIY